MNNDKYLEFAKDYLDFCGIKYDDEFLFDFRCAVREDIQHCYNLGIKLFYSDSECKTYRKLTKSDIKSFIRVIELAEAVF
jgi:hypothetical protein